LYVYDDRGLVNQVSGIYIMTMVYISLSLYVYNDHGLHIMIMVYESLS